MLLFRFLSATIATSILLLPSGTISYSTILLVGSLSLASRASTATAFRIVHRGYLCSRQQSAVRIKGFNSGINIRNIRNRSRSSSRPFFSSINNSNNSSSSNNNNNNNNISMAKKRKSSGEASTTVATRRSTRRCTSKPESSVKDPRESDEQKRKPQERKPSSSPSSLLPYKMLMILSPAKTLNLNPEPDTIPVASTEPLACLQAQRTEVVASVQQHAKSASKLGDLLKTSAKITAIAHGYWKAMSPDGTTVASKSSSEAATETTTATLGSKPAIVTFDGAAYSGLNVRDDIATNSSNLQYLQDHLRIVDPLYGWLRPMDQIKAYRLEMASKGVFASDKKLKLEDYWKPGIASCLLAEEEDETTPSAAAAIVVVNLASDEYSAALGDRPMIKIVFRHGGRTIAVHAKRARGLMVRYAALNGIESVDGLKAFDSEGYSYQPDQSTYDGRGGAESLLRTREEPPADSKPKKKKAEPLTLVFDRPGTWKKPK